MIKGRTGEVGDVDYEFKLASKFGGHDGLDHCTDVIKGTSVAKHLQMGSGSGFVGIVFRFVSQTGGVH